MKLKQSQAGFSVPHLLLGLVAVAIVGFAGWRVYEARKEANQSYDNAANANEVTKQDAKKKEEPKKEAYKVPDGFTVYENKEYGFFMAYPQKWGQLSPTADVSLVFVSTPAAYDEKLASGARVGSNLYVRIEKKAGFKVGAYKYGPFISPEKSGNDIVWRVVEKDSGVEKYKVGDVYPLKSAQNKRGTKVYDLSFFDEGYHTGWLLETSKAFVHLYTPSVGMEDMSVPTAADKKEFTELTEKVFNSFMVQ
ncbi:MAG TPA: hypothetical protein VK694_00070 [Verrucomicrobiae bacterium]|nr:hypothetical protein [Verrucomicrobiae bacterium]